MGLISVIIPVYNGQRYLECALSSILAQTLRDIEVIVIDDGSTDASMSILDKFAGRDKRVRVISQNHGGIEAALNAGVSNASSPFIARMDCDDIAMPDRLQKQLQFMQSHENVALLGGAYRLIDGAGRYLTTLYPPTDNATLQEQLLSGRNPFCHPLIVMRKDAFEKAGGFVADLPAAEDLDLWLRLGEIGEVACLSEVLLDYRMHDSSISESRQALQITNMRLACERAWKRRHIIGEFKGSDPWRPLNSRESRHDFALRYGWWAFKNRQRRTAMIYGTKAIRINPWNSQGWRLLACAFFKSPQAPVTQAIQETKRAACCTL